MPCMINIVKLLNNLRREHWHITAFPFGYNGKEYIVLFEDIENLPLVADEYRVLLTFIDRANENHILQTKANEQKFSIGAKVFREYFGIKYVPNLGDILRQFYAYFGQFIPESRVTQFDHETTSALVKKLSRNDNDNANAQCCYKVIRNGKYNGIQHYRTPFNSDKTKLLRPELFNKLGGDNKISFCYRENNPLTDIEIYEQFMRSYGIK